MIKLDDLMGATLPAEIIYSGKAKVPKKLQRLTITRFGNLNIRFLGERGSTSVETNNGFMWILDVLIHYDLAKVQSGVEKPGSSSVS